MIRKRGNDVGRKFRGGRERKDTLGEAQRREGRCLSCGISRRLSDESSLCQGPVTREARDDCGEQRQGRWGGVKSRLHTRGNKRTPNLLIPEDERDGIGVVIEREWCEWPDTVRAQYLHVDTQFT